MSAVNLTFKIKMVPPVRCSFWGVSEASGMAQALPAGAQVEAHSDMECPVHLQESCKFELGTLLVLQIHWRILADFSLSVASSMIF